MKLHLAAQTVSKLQSRSLVESGLGLELRQFLFLPRRRLRKSTVQHLVGSCRIRLPHLHRMVDGSVEHRVRAREIAKPPGRSDIRKPDQCDSGANERSTHQREGDARDDCQG